MCKILRRIVSVALAIAAGVALGQTPAARLAFEKASIKLSPPIKPAAMSHAAQPIHAGMKIDGTRVDIGNFSIAALIVTAYDVKPYQIVGPDWLTAMTAQRFDVLAKIPSGTTEAQVLEMLRTLLAERFKLSIHRDTKDLAFYALVVGEGGPKLKKAESLTTTASRVAPDGRPKRTPVTDSRPLTFSASGKGAVVTDGEGGQQKMSVGADGKSMHIENTKISMSKLAELLSPMLDRPVVDMTELTGDYQVVLDIPMEALLASATTAGGGYVGRTRVEAADPSSGSLSASVQQLGLKLEARRAPTEAIVIDRVEKTPTEN